MLLILSHVTLNWYQMCSVIAKHGFDLMYILPYLKKFKLDSLAIMLAPSRPMHFHGMLWAIADVIKSLAAVNQIYRTGLVRIYGILNVLSIDEVYHYRGSVCLSPL